MPHSKRALAALCLRYSGAMKLLEALPAQPVLLVLNYHRIGDPDQTPYDPGVFSATAEELDDQVRFLKRRFHLATLEEAIEMAQGRPPRGATALLTFDDGYRDNYETAFPILSAHRAPATFFLPTAFIGTNRTPLWDAAAYIVKNSRKRRFRLSLAPLREFDIEAEGARTAVESVLEFYKKEAGGEEERFLAALEDACECPRPDGSDRLFLNWEAAAAMMRGGMDIGSHTHTHPVLSRTGPEELERELTCSRSILETRLGLPVRALAYPFGVPETISGEVFRAAERAGYSAAFSFFGGVNLPGAMEPYNLKREAVSPEEAQTFRLNANLRAIGR